ncbi:cell division protein SepF [Bacillus cereus]|uniref:cell division protein SepF n=1 Tax=Bacillus cereus TaxID=1396 RepID=UPI0008FDDF52|nr:cell division protein SepF [Bacillus cereus]MDA1974307.1 cell division protein SepF [Bacillus cereus]
MKQLTLEDVVGSFDYKAINTSEKFLNQNQEPLKGSVFDKKKAHIKNKPGNKGFTNVRAMIPKQAKSSQELSSKEKIDPKFDMFIDYVTAIWRYNRDINKDFSWDEAEALFKKHRDQKKSIAMRILLDDGFEPQFVTRYLKWEGNENVNGL